MHKFGFIARMLGAVLATLAALSVQAQGQYPEGTVRMIVPYGSGGGIDGFTRVVAQQLGEIWGQNVIVENKPGAGTTLGSDYVARAEPNGYTLLMNASSIAIAFGTYSKLPFKASDLTPVIVAARMPMVLVVGTSVPVNSLKELIELSKTRPGGVTIGSSGQGGISHLALELLMHRSPLRATHVPYKTTGASVPDVIGGRIDGFFATAAGVMPHIQKGSVKPMAVSSVTRFKFLPDVPTVQEAGISDYEIQSWFGLFAPAGTPSAIVAKIHRDVSKALETPAAKRILEAQGLESANVPPDEFRRLFEAEIKTWVTLVKETGLKFN